MAEIDEPSLIQALIAEATVEALDVGVLDRFAWTDEVQRNAARVRPRIKRLARELGAVVADDRPRRSALGDELAQDASDTEARDRCVDFDRDAFAREIVDDVERAEDATVGELIGDEVHRPTLVRFARKDERLSCDCGDALANATAHDQAFSAVDSIDAFVVDDVTIATQKDVESSVAKARALGCVLAQSNDEFG